ncbi:MAG: hypothetical protein EB116_14380 [Betaproteobacteria bacterium]|nr:hypothetical protein [Betaproteobacteria bacterium]
MLLALHQIDDAASLHASDALCTALQKINMLQDSGVDAKRGRIYVPACELRALGYDAEHWFRFCSEGSLPEDLRQWIQRQAMAQSEQLRLHQPVPMSYRHRSWRVRLQLRCSTGRYLEYAAQSLRSGGCSCLLPTSDRTR